MKWGGEWDVEIGGKWLVGREAGCGEDMADSSARYTISKASSPISDCLGGLIHDDSHPPHLVCSIRWL